MKLESTVLIRRPPEAVWRYLSNIDNVAQWDRGVENVEQTSAPPAGGVGLEFDTLAKSRRHGQEWGRMSYRIAEAGDNRCVVQLTSSGGNARFFRTAQWVFSTAPHPAGTLLTCAAEFTLRFRYLFLGPILYAKKSAIGMDLEALKQALEK